MSEPSPFRSATATSRLPRRAALMVLIAVLPWLVGPGCGGDGDSGVLEDACLEFTASSSSASGNVITRAGDDSSCSLAVLEVVATSIDDVWALSTSVTYDETLVTFDGYSTANSILAQDGAAVAASIEITDAGLLTVGVSRLDAEAGVNIGAEGGVLVELFFTPYSTTAASGALGLEDDCLLDSGGVDSGPAPIAGVNCYGGTLFVR